MNSIADHILDITNNSIRAAATRIEIGLGYDDQAHTLTFSVLDNGKGMEASVLEQVTDPFFTSRKSRKQGFGLPFIKMNAELTGGSFSIESIPGAGTRLETRFITNHIDMLPVGDLAGVLTILFTSEPDIDIHFTFKTNEQEFQAGNQEILEIFNEFPAGSASCYTLIKTYLHDNIELKTLLEV